MINDIRNAIKEISGTKVPVIIGHRCKVEKVNDDRTCDVKLLNTDLVITSVRLQAVPGQTNGFYIKPVVGSWVIIMWLDEQTPVIVLTGNSALIELGGNENGGIVKAGAIHTRMKNCEDKVNEILEALKTTVIPLAPSGTYPLSTDFGEVESIVDQEQSTIENTNITH